MLASEVKKLEGLSEAITFASGLTNVLGQSEIEDRLRPSIIKDLQRSDSVVSNTVVILEKCSLAENRVVFP